ncbi:MAG: hypothetical protein ACOC28_08240 [Alkalispirochaetaceae bacterium]
MILLLVPEGDLATRLSRKLRLKRIERTSVPIASSPSILLAELGTEPVRACARTGYILGRQEEQREAAVALILSTELRESRFTPLAPPRGVASTRKESYAPASLALKVEGPSGVFYPDPLLTASLPAGTLVSPLASAILSCLGEFKPWDLVYPIVVPPQDESHALEEYLSALEDALPEEEALIPREDERQIEELSATLRLSHASRQLLIREAGACIVRRGALPEELAGYASLTCSSRQEGEKLLASILELLRETTG